MTVNNLYKYQREDGKWTVTPRQEEVPTGAVVTVMYRLIPDAGMVLTQDGENVFWSVDTESVEGWYEIEEPEPPEE